MKNTVKTYGKAIEIVLDAANAERESSDIISTENTTSKCECGECEAATAYVCRHNKCIKMYTVAICDSCGDDDNRISDVLEVQ